MLYDKSEFNFRGVIQEALGVTNLEKLHEHTKDISVPEAPGKDQGTNWHRLYYQNKDKFQELYERFIREVIYPSWGTENLVYQAVPTFRVQLVGSLSVAVFHKDRDYNHQSKEINYYLPITNRVYGNNTIWIESEEDKGDYAPIEAEYGQVVIFDGANLCHGNHINDTEDTRVSLDFRVLSEEDFLITDMKSVSSSVSMTIGDYYKVYRGEE